MYGSFCRARITVTSDDKAVQEVLAQTGESTAYFAVGDAFTCGSWISQPTLNKITNIIGDKAREDAGEGSAKEDRDLMWTQLISTVAGGIGGYIGTNALQNNGLLGGSSKNTKDQEKELKQCLENVDKARSATGNNKIDLANKALRNAKLGGAKVSDINYFTQKTSADYSYNKDDVARIKEVVDTTRKDTKCKSDCSINLDSITALLFNTPTSYTEKTSEVKKMLSSAKENCGDGCANLNNIDNIQLRVEENKAGTVSANNSEINSGLDKIANACADAQTSSNGNSGKVWKNLAGAGVGALVTGMAGYQIAKTVKKADYEAAANSAVKAWMNEVGEHIQCYLGTEELGSYGDTIAFTIEE